MRPYAMPRPDTGKGAATRCPIGNPVPLCPCGNSRPGFESGGVAAAHAVHNGFSALEECHKMYHGEKVAFGVITQLVLENAPEEELNEVLDFCISVGLPVTLKQIGVEEFDYDKILKVAKIACAPTDTAVNMPFDIDPEMVANAIIAADALGEKRLQSAR